MFSIYKDDMNVPKTFTSIEIGIASPDEILSWSYGEVTKQETVNYRTYKPEKDGLFCERIFGPEKDYECACGKYKGIRHKGIVCERCGVEVTSSAVRRERMGHIKLAVPVAHIWYVRGTSSRIGQLLGLKLKDLERVIYYESYIVIDPGTTELAEYDLISEAEFREHKKEDPNKFKAEIGAEAIRIILQNLNTEETYFKLKKELREVNSIQKKKQIIKRLRIIEGFKNSGNRPEWMIMEALPVLPPKLRPLVALPGGKFATSDLNDLYRKVINRNNRLKKMIQIRAPKVILRNEKRILQEAVDALLDNSKRSRPVLSRNNRPLKSLSDALKGKTGRFRGNLLGKRVDYSGRSVIVVGPELKMHQCGLPKEMAKELFKPFIINKLLKRNIVQTVRQGKKLVDNSDPAIWDALDEVIKAHPVMLNRAPTLHRLGIQAFEPKLIEGRAIQLHPLVCEAFNADFDGDQMAVHVPLSYEAILEARLLMLATNNILKPANGNPIVNPSQDMVLGCYFLTKEKDGAKGEGKLFKDFDEVILAYSSGVVDLHAKIKVRLNPGEYLDTTVGRVIFNRIVPEGIDYINKVLTKKELERVIADIFNKTPGEPLLRFLDDMKNTGFSYSTISGSSFGIDDMIVPDDKFDLIDKTKEKIEKIQLQYRNGFMSDGERYNRVIEEWTKTTDILSQKMYDLIKVDQDGFNPIFMMADSGARGSREQLKQLAAARGLIQKPSKKITGGIGEIIENAVTSNYKEGLTGIEYFISTSGGRKGIADTALKTADAGYLTRKLVDVAQDVVIREDDCGTTTGLVMKAIKDNEEIMESLSERIVGRYTAREVLNPISKKIVAHENELITEELAEKFDNLGISEVEIRSVITCRSRVGICAKCYGVDLSNNKKVNNGTAVGIIAAQSIGEPGTQLTLRTFHVGGTASVVATQSAREAKTSGKVQFIDISSVIDREKRNVIVSKNSKINLINEEGNVVPYDVPYGAYLKVEDGQNVEKGDTLYEWDPYSAKIITHTGGKVKFIHIVDGITLKEEFDELSGHKQMTIVDPQNRSYHPQIQIFDPETEEKVGDYIIPIGAILYVKDGQDVEAGDLLVKIPRQIIKTRDITGGLPRVTELFEARKPKDPAVISEVDGVVKMGDIVHGMRRIYVIDDYNESHEYRIPYGKYIMVHEGDRVKAGERLCDGAINLHDMLNILGPGAVQSYLLREIQEVYRLQGVKINDKHIAIIIRQMMKKVQVVDPGDSEYINEDIEEKHIIDEVNEQLREEGGKPVITKPLLLGITKSALSNESFISAASFQETTKVLTDAAIRGKVDYLQGLKENVIMGQLIPCGTGMAKYKKIRLIKRLFMEPKENIPGTENQNEVQGTNPEL